MNGKNAGALIPSVPRINKNSGQTAFDNAPHRKQPTRICLRLQLLFLAFALHTKHEMSGIIIYCVPFLLFAARGKLAAH
jgi:hypothetical protein